tara:strand:+ start:109 stop:696 length:588 start_codon:yes stop_codon:yes gene_type:complete
MPGSTLSGAGAGAAAGAAIGTAFGPGGTAIGAGVGAVVGGVSGFVSDVAGWSAAGDEESYLGSELDTLNQSLDDLTGLGTIRRGIELEKFEEQKEQLAFGTQTSLQDILESYNRATQQTGLAQSGAVADQRKRAITQVKAEQDFGMESLIGSLGSSLMSADEWQGGREASIRETIADVERRKKKAHSESTPWPFD